MVQIFLNKRVMQCSLCRHTGHTKGKCPGRATEEGRVEEEQRCRTEQEGPLNKKVAGSVKKKAAKEVRRQKIAVRRKGIQQCQ